MFSTADTTLLTWFNQNYIPGSIPFLQFVSAATTYVSVGMLLITLAIALLRKSIQFRTYFYMMSTVLIMSAITSPVLKSVFNRERPFYTHGHIEKRSTGGKSSFPSGHTLEAFSMAMAVANCFRRRRLTLVVFVWASLVGYSRMALGVHYPSDVIGGIVIGILIGWAVPAMFSKYFSGRKQNSGSI